MAGNEYRSRSSELKRPGNCETKLLLRLVNYLDLEVSQDDSRTWSAEKNCELSVLSSQLVLDEASL